jgi:hypothetical protein
MDRRKFLSLVGMGTPLAAVIGCGDVPPDPAVLRATSELARVTKCTIHSCQGGFFNPGPNDPSGCNVESCIGGFTCSTGPSGGGHICDSEHSCDGGHSCAPNYIACGVDLAPATAEGPRTIGPTERAADARRELAGLLKRTRERPS